MGNGDSFPVQDQDQDREQDQAHDYHRAPPSGLQIEINRHGEVSEVQVSQVNLL
jgi:hypothetical protein